MFKYVAVCMIMAMAERSLPLPDRDVPNSVSMSNGRVDYHGWLFLPFEHQEQAPKSLSGWLYHHTPEFFVHSPHDFEIMVEGRIDFDETAQKVISHFPIPPSLVGQEYVFTPPEFSLDELITSKPFPPINGKFSNGSFDTDQTKRSLITESAHLTIKSVPTVHYLTELTTVGLKEATYLSYPRNPRAYSVSGKQYFYLIHLLEAGPDYDQTIQVEIDIGSCIFYGADTVEDLVHHGATIVVNSLSNDMMKRLRPGPTTKNLSVSIMTENTRDQPNHTQCRMKVLEEIHCVVVPNSFDPCPV